MNDNNGDDTYSSMAQEFNETTGIADREVPRTQEYIDRFAVLEEEVEELDEVIGMMETRRYFDNGLNLQKANDMEEEAVEELADVLITVWTMAEALGVDLRAAFERKMGYNLHKTGSEFVDGKVQDDANIPKPDFDGLANGDGPDWEEL